MMLLIGCKGTNILIKPNPDVDKNPFSFLAEVIRDTMPLQSIELVNPANNQIIQYLENEEITFSWEPKKVKPEIDVLYKIVFSKNKISSIGKTKSVIQEPIFEETITNKTSFSISINNLKPSKGENKKESYSWRIYVLDKNGLPACKDGCKSGENNFFLEKVDTLCHMEIFSKRISCSSPAYDLTAVPPTAKYNVSITLVNFAPTLDMNWWDFSNPTDRILVTGGNATVTNEVYSSITLASNGGQATVNFDLIVDIGTPSVNFTYLAHSQTINPATNLPECELGPPETFNLERCICKPCERFSTKWQNSFFPPHNVQIAQLVSTSHQDYDLLTIDDVISVSSGNITKVQAEIVYFNKVPIQQSKECNTCNRRNSSHAEFIGNNNTITGSTWQNSGSPVDFIDLSSDQESRGIYWVTNSSSGTNMTGTPMHLEIGIPKLSQLSGCCENCFWGAIRYSFTDAKCNVCEVLRYFYVCK